MCMFGGWGGIGMVNILVYTKRQKAPNADRKHETTPAELHVKGHFEAYL